MMGYSPGFAAIVSIVSLSFALGMIMQMIILVVRRQRIERGVVMARASERLMSRELMAVISGSMLLEHAPTFSAAACQDRLRTLSHLLQLVRGEDRQSLLNVADRAHVLTSAINGLGQRRQARRVDSMRILEQFSTPASIAALLGCMNEDPCLAVRTEAAAALARMGHLPDPATVIKMLDLENQPLTRLHEALFRSSALRDADQLALLATDSRLCAMRPLLVEALGWSGEFAIVGRLLDHSDDGNPEVRCAALKAARRLGHPEAAGWAVRLLLDPVDSVRIQAIQTCAKLGAHDAIPIMVSLIQHPSWWVRMRAKEALDTLRPYQKIHSGVTGFSQ